MALYLNDISVLFFLPAKDWKCNVFLKENRDIKSQAVESLVEEKAFIYSCNLNIFVAEVVTVDHSTKININR